MAPLVYVHIGKLFDNKVLHRIPLCSPVSFNFRQSESKEAMEKYPVSWADMSQFVVHFTSGSKGEDDYRNMMSIYWDGVLKPMRPFGIGRRESRDPTSQHAVCFSEIPPGQWKRLKDRRETKFGIAFLKKFVLSQGGGPIWYVWKDTPHWNVLQNMMYKERSNTEADIWRITPFIDALGEYNLRPYFFDWEREWRYVGHFSFKPDDVVFLLLAENLHSAARSFFEDAYNENTGPAYFCPYIDPSWERSRILAELSKT